MNSSIELMCGPENDQRLLSISLSKNDDFLNIISVGFTGGIDSAFLLYLVAKLNSMQEIPYIIQPITVLGDKFAEQLKYIPIVIDYIKRTTNQQVYDTKFIHIDDTLINATKQLNQGFGEALKYSKLLCLGDTEHPPLLSIDYLRNFSKDTAIYQPFQNLNKSHIIDAMIKLDLEDLIKLAPKCVRYHKYWNSYCSNFFCKERRWAYNLLKRNDLLEQFLSRDSE